MPSHATVPLTIIIAVSCGGAVFSLVSAFGIYYFSKRCKSNSDSSQLRDNRERSNAYNYAPPSRAGEMNAMPISAHGMSPMMTSDYRLNTLGGQFLAQATLPSYGQNSSMQRIAPPRQQNEFMYQSMARPTYGSNGISLNMCGLPPQMMHQQSLSQQQLMVLNQLLPQQQMIMLNQPMPQQQIIMHNNSMPQQQMMMSQQSLAQQQNMQQQQAYGQSNYFGM